MVTASRLTANETGRMAMNIKIVLLYVFTALCFQASLAWGGTIYKTVPMLPSDLNTPLVKPGKNKMYTHIGCVNAATGNFISCGYDFKITKLKQPVSDVENNGGHTHTYADHPLGQLEVVKPVGGSLIGQTSNSYVYFAHEIPHVSGKIETALNLRVPPGWHTVSPESCDTTRTYWCFETTVDVGLNLIPLPDNPALYKKFRSPDTRHTNEVAFYGTGTALNNINEISDWHNQLALNRTLSINDMSLIKGGIFDINGNYSPSHYEHRTGESADINKEGVDCIKNKFLLLATFLVMGRDGGRVFADRQLPSLGHFLCETNLRNNIHIDL